MISLLLILGSTLTFAASEATNLFEKSFARDNTFCHNKTGRIEISIRGGSRFIEPVERGFGEYLFTRTDRKKITALELNSLRSDSFKFFPGVSPFCSKGQGYQIDDNTLAVLFLKENKPFKEKLVIQLFDFKALTPKEYVETNYSTNKAKKIEGGFAFNSFAERLDTDMGKVTIDGVSYTYQDREFPQWVGYTAKGFETLPSLTFQQFTWKEGFKDETEFLTLTGWDAKQKRFVNEFLYIAVNHAVKKGCLLFTKEKKKFDGTEGWRCQTM